MDAVVNIVLVAITVGGIYALVALGFALIFGVLDFVNLVHGEIVVLAVYGALLSYGALGGYLSATLVGIGLALVVGMILYAGALRFIADREHDVQIVFTFALLVLLQNLMQLAFGANAVAGRMGQETIVEVAGARMLSSRVVAGAVALVLVLAVAWVLANTSFGRSVRALGANRFGAALSGVNPRATAARTFALGVLLAAAAGGLIAPFTTAQPHAGLELTLKAFVVVMVAGLGQVYGLVVTGVLLAIVEAIGVNYLPRSVSTVAGFLVLIPVLIFRPRGLFRAAAR